MLVATVDKAGNGGFGEVNAEEIMQQLAGASVGNGLTSDQVRCYGLDADPLRCWSWHIRRKRGAGQMQAVRTLLLFDMMFRDPEPFHWEIDHLPPLGQTSGIC